MRLHLAHGCDQLDRTCRIADPPAGHRIGFRDAVHGQGAIIKPRFDFGRGAELEPVKGQMLIHVIRHHPDMRVFHQNIGERLQLVPGIARARRVGGGVEDEPFGLRRDGGVKLLCGDFEAVFELAFDRDGRAAAEQDHIGVGHPVGRGDDDLVARIERGHQRIVEHLFAAAGDRDLRRRVVQPVVAFELGADRLFQLGDAIDGGVFRLALFNGANPCGLDVLRRVEIRLTRAQPDHILARGFQLACLVGHGDGGRRFHTGERF